jgi:hypothetical protein
MKSALLLAACLLSAPALAGGSYDSGGPGGFNRSTMLGWQHRAEPAALAYVRMPFHGQKHDRFQPRAGLMLSAPRTYNAGEPLLRAGAPGLVDLGYTGRDFKRRWTPTLNASTAVVWTSDRSELPKNTHHLFDSGASWVVVGVATVGIIAGIYVLSDQD